MQPEPDPELREDALAVLGELLGWEATDGGWRHIGDLVTRADTAVVERDWPALRTAISELELASPLRTTKLGEPPRRPAPEPVRERVNRLVHALSHEQPKPTDRHTPG